MRGVDGILAQEHGIAVQGPGLAAGPGGIIRKALDRLFAPDGAVRSVIYKVPGGIVVPEMVFQGGFSVADAHLLLFGGAVAEQQFEVHHVVDDDRVIPFSEIPAPDAANLRIEPLRQLGGALPEDVGRFAAAGQAPGMAETAGQLEAQVMVGMPADQGGEPVGMEGGPLEDLLVSGILPDIPQRAREETAAPPVQVGGAEGIGLEAAREGAGPFGGHVFLQEGVLLPGEVENPLGQVWKGFLGLGAGGQRQEGQHQGGQSFSHDGEICREYSKKTCK